MRDYFHRFNAYCVPRDLGSEPQNAAGLSCNALGEYPGRECLDIGIRVVSLAFQEDWVMVTVRSAAGLLLANLDVIPPSPDLLLRRQLHMRFQGSIIVACG
jgi:hypothetical protein